MPRDLDETSLARARARLQLGLPDGPLRTVARQGIQPVDVDVLSLTAICALADPGQRADVLKSAASAYHAHEIAQAIEPKARAELSSVLSPAMRAFALKNRGLARPLETEAAAFADRFQDTLDEMERLLKARLAGVSQQPNSHVACLDAALEDIA